MIRCQITGLAGLAGLLQPKWPAASFRLSMQSHFGAGVHTRHRGPKRAASTWRLSIDKRISLSRPKEEKMVPLQLCPLVERLEPHQTTRLISPVSHHMPGSRLPPVSPWPNQAIGVGLAAGHPTFDQGKNTI